MTELVQTWQLHHMKGKFRTPPKSLRSILWKPLIPVCKFSWQVCNRVVHQPPGCHSSIPRAMSVAWWIFKQTHMCSKTPIWQNILGTNTGGFLCWLNGELYELVKAMLVKWKLTRTGISSNTDYFLIYGLYGQNMLSFSINALLHKCKQDCAEWCCYTDTITTLEHGKQHRKADYM